MHTAMLPYSENSMCGDGTFSVSRHFVITYTVQHTAHNSGQWDNRITLPNENLQSDRRNSARICRGKVHVSAIQSR